MQIILHIGTEKTATTTLQRFLYQNRKTLLEAGYGLSDVLDRPNNRALPAPDPPGGLFSQLGITTLEEREAYFKGFEGRFAREVERFAKTGQNMIADQRAFPFPPARQRPPDSVPMAALLEFWDGLMAQLATLPVLSPRQALSLSDFAKRLEAGETLSETERDTLKEVAQRAVSLAPHTLQG